MFHETFEQDSLEPCTKIGSTKMEVFVSLKIEPLEEGGFLATSEELQGLVAQGRTAAETLEIAQDVARRLIESCIEHNDPLARPIQQAIDSQRARKANVRIPVFVAQEAQG